MKWCCEHFKDKFESAGQQETAIVVVLDDLGHPHFLLQNRISPQGSEITKLGGTISVLSLWENEMRYCLTCGRNLNKWYRKYVKEMIRQDINTAWGSAEPYVVESDSNSNSSR